jgi:hypothetical protein
VRFLELQVREGLELLGSGGHDLGPGHLPVGAACVGDDLLRVVEESDDALHHTDGLVQWAIVIPLGEGVLLKEIFPDDLGDLYKRESYNVWKWILLQE